jgi:hypothetical protein
LNKARRGELFTCVPVGYVRSADGGIALDPDEQARSVVALVFAKFAELGSVTKLLDYFATRGIRLGTREHRGPCRGQLVWRPAPAVCPVRDAAALNVRWGLRLRAAYERPEPEGLGPVEDGA